ncbi:pyridoxamine 5'-phosphate oxidase family protein [Streptomyces sp. NBC_01304]|uniref:pyridoxamine 5'-phosphate oxidase family protein n=1 Tax=Streptomyces sp. NBC_01304 TaxID=2903818 RepID=UPI002E0F264D|nr:pyridoxamine 5'-phosphate oxidase family protein [Streptomyces sp. NBC_01304]
MPDEEPRAELDPDFSEEGATATPWPDAVSLLAAAELYWISTVRPDGRPHVTPLHAVWADEALHFCTGPEERKALNLAGNPHVALTTGTNTWNKGYDLVVEGTAVRVTDDGRLRALARAWGAKYGDAWKYEARDGAFRHEGGHALVFEVAPRKVLGFGKGGPFSQTRWTF